MKKSMLTGTFFLSIMFTLATNAFATNGDNLIGVGPVSRSMGGVGIAQPQDAVSSIFSNPATMVNDDISKSTEFDFAGTVFMPRVKASVERTSGTVQADSSNSIFSIPAIGLNTPVSKNLKDLRFGIAAYGVTGLGVDYRGTALDNSSAYDFGGGMTAPLVQGEYTQLQIMKFAPSLAYRINDMFSAGAAVQIDYSTLDLRHGSSSAYGLGVNLGVVIKPVAPISIGLTYTTPQNVNYRKVIDFEAPEGSLDSLKLESPQEFGAGVAYTNANLLNLLIEGDIKLLQWSRADGYKDFDWNDQWVYSIGVKIEPIRRLSLRAGYNYAKNPLKNHDGFDGSFNPMTGMPNSVNDVQGHMLPTYYYETFRIIGFPAIVENHLTLGVGYSFSDTFTLNVGWMHAFEKTINESGTDLFGQPVTLSSTLVEDSLDFGLTWNF
jgi:long-chain fatty acid transport protein